MSAQNNVSSVYLDNVDFFINTSNMVNLSWPDVSEAFAKPLMLNSFPISGYDWTQPYPGKDLVDGHGVRLSITDDFTIDDRRDVKNSTTILTSLTFSIPEHMRRKGKALPMDPSWYICRHIFISTNPEAKNSADRGKCGTITQECANDLAADLTWEWGYANDDSMCSQRIGHPIPNSCVGSLGYSVQDILVANSTIVADPVLGPLQTSGKQQQNSWRIGTGYHRPRDPLAFEKVYNRTYLVATVWGFSRGTDPKDVKIPRITWTCVSGGTPWVPPAHDFPDPPPHLHETYAPSRPPSTATSSRVTTSSTITSGVTTSFTTTSTGSASSATPTSTGPTSTEPNLQIVYLFTVMLIISFVLDEYASIM